MKEREVVTSLITPNAKTINDVFQKKERYFIDIYQRDYKWEKSQIETLLRDIELRFNLTERKITDPKKIKEDVVNRYQPYFLNTYLTCKTSNYISIVDGQQRLTTFLIILIKLKQLVQEVHKDEAYTSKTVSVNTIEKLIFEANDFGEAEYYKIYNPNRQEYFNSILAENTSIETKEETQKKIIENYVTISSYFDKLFKSSDDSVRIDVVKLTHYIYYVLEKLNIVEIRIEHQENVATIFEVVNDRGLGLKPYEILKGKFLGNLKTSDKENANAVWVGLQNSYYNSKIKNSTENQIDLDSFFKIYLRAKFADTENDYQKYEDKYHYEIYQNEKILYFFKRFEDNEKLYKWVTDDFKYFAELYLKIRIDYNNEYLIFNKLLDQNQQYLLIMASMNLKDNEEQQKINFIAKKFDQLHTTLRLLDQYESNMFQEFVYKLLSKIRNKKLDELKGVFDSVLIEYLENENIISKGAYNTIAELYKWELFQNIKNKWLNFSKYVLMRIDRYLAFELDKPSYCKESMLDIEERFNKNNLKRYGMHLEHIYAFNDKNKALFTTKDNLFDESSFNVVRNKLGMVLLLKDKQNISSNNDYYSLKKEDYATSNLIWNELLVGHIDSIDRRNLPTQISFTKIDPTSDGIFPLDKVEIRQKDIFEMIKLIWAF